MLGGTSQGSPFLNGTLYTVRLYVASWGGGEYSPLSHPLYETLHAYTLRLRNDL